MSVSLHHGDCLDVLRGMEEGSIDHVITDPPYSVDVYDRMRGTAAMREVGGNGKPAGVSKLAKMAAGEIGAVDELAPKCAVEIARLVCRWAIVFSDAEFACEWRRLLIEAGMRYVRTGCWAKPDAMPQMTGDRPAVGFEPCTICHGPEKMRWNGGGLPALWIVPIAKGKSRPDHPCPKPLPLMLRLVEQFTDPGDLVCDPFMGSGTTGAACVELGRSFIGIEKDEHWYNVAKARIEAAQQNKHLIPVGYKRKTRRML